MGCKPRVRRRPLRMKTDRRRGQRRPLALPITFRVRGAMKHGTTLDVSPTGVALLAPEPPPLNEWIELIFAGPTFVRPVRVSARVRRVARRLFGMPLAGLELDLDALDAGDRARFQEGVRDALKGKAVPSASRFLIAGRCAKCGWSGTSSRFVRTCPRCGGALDTAAA